MVINTRVSVISGVADSLQKLYGELPTLQMNDLWSLTRFPRVKNEEIFMTPHAQQYGESLTLCIEQYMDHRLTIVGSQVNS